MKNYYLDKSKSGTKRLNLVLEYAKFGDVSKVGASTLKVL